LDNRIEKLLFARNLQDCQPEGRKNAKVSQSFYDCFGLEVSFIRDRCILKCFDYSRAPKIPISTCIIQEVENDRDSLFD
jgi:hypothetical protein